MHELIDKDGFYGKYGGAFCFDPYKTRVIF